MSCLGVGALAMAGSRVSSDVPQQATSCRLLVPLSTKLTSFPSRLGGGDDRQLPQAHAAFSASSQERDPPPPLLNREDNSASLITRAKGLPVVSELCSFFAGCWAESCGSQ